MIVYLHIGTGKTGTTSIQTFLELNREALQKQGIIFPQSPGRRNHRRLTMYALNDGIVDNSRRSRGLLQPEQLTHFREEFRRRFREEAATWRGAKAIVMSSEQMTRLKRPGEIARLRSLIDFAAQVKIIVYFRRQDDYFLSEYSQLVKGGQSITVDQALNRQNMQVYNYDVFARNWANEFGRENIVVRPFERQQLTEGDVVRDFVSVVGIDPAAEYQVPPRQNLSLDRYTVEFLRRLNPHIPRYVDGAPNRAREGLAEVLETISDGPKLALPRATAEAFLRKFEECNAKVAREYLGRGDGVLFRDKPADLEDDGSELDEDKSMAITAKLWCRLRGQAAKP